MPKTYVENEFRACFVAIESTNRREKKPNISINNVHELKGPYCVEYNVNCAKQAWLWQAWNWNCTKCSVPIGIHTLFVVVVISLMDIGGVMRFVPVYSALSIYRGLFSPNNSRKTPIARPLGRDMVVFRDFLIWPKFYLGSYCAVDDITVLFFGLASLTLRPSYD